METYHLDLAAPAPQPDFDPTDFNTLSNEAKLLFSLWGIRAAFHYGYYWMAQDSWREITGLGDTELRKAYVQVSRFRQHCDQLSYTARQARREDERRANQKGRL